MPPVPDAAGLLRPLVPARERTLPLLPELKGLLPGGLPRGWVVSAGSTTLALLLAAGPSQGGSWVGAVGLPSLGAVAAAQAGVRLERLALVPRPGPRWAEVTAALLDGLDVVLVRGPVGGREARRLAARARERGAVLVAVGPWEGADLRLSVAADRWEGLGRGWGHLARRELEVRAEGRGAAARPRQVRLVVGAAPPAPGRGPGPWGGVQAVPAGGA